MFIVREVFIGKSVPSLILSPICFIYLWKDNSFDGFDICLSIDFYIQSLFLS